MVILLIILVVAVLLVSIYAVMLFLRNTQMRRNIDHITASAQLFDEKLLGRQLEGLRYKLNPHLFKNALNSIQSHAYQTYRALDKLSVVLDYVLYESDKELVTLDREMNFITNLIEINRIKLSPLFDLNVKNNIDIEEARQFSILALSTVDLIENAFKHTDFTQPNAFIAIGFILKNNTFELEVRNTASTRIQLMKPHSGIGLQTLKNRLDIIYPGKHQLDMSQSGEVFTAHLKLQLTNENA